MNISDRQIILTGLTNEEVLERRKEGLGNDVKLKTSRTYRSIVLTNVFYSVNVVLYVIGFGMLLVGDVRSAVTVVGLVIFNAVVGIVQEIRSKRKLDEIALLARAKVNVLRDSQEQEIDPGELVLGDILVVNTGDQIQVDGVLVGDGKLEVDESALTGESDLIPKSEGDEVLSGSFCITGKTLVQSTGVGEQSFANKLTKDAREFKSEPTPLQRDVNRLLRVLLLIVIFFSILMGLGLLLLDLPLDSWLQVMAVITGSISAGLLTLITLNYSWGAVRIGQKGGLVQQINAIESLSNVTVLCTDKTGTLTANKIRFNDVQAEGIERQALEQLLGDFSASASALNKTSQAIMDKLPGVVHPFVDEVPFSSTRKWSALAFDDPGSEERPPLKGCYVLGALEMLESYFSINEGARATVEAWSAQGLRVLVFAGNREVTWLHDENEAPLLPELELLGVVSFSDELRPHLQETLSAFTDNGVRLKVISGDNPQTVAALARQAGLPGDLQAVSGTELAEMGPGEFAQTAQDATVFGRISPQQKEGLVQVLRDQEEYVAMIGDGVNDVLSLKKSNLGIAMESGSTATRAVAAMVLLGDSFEAMPDALVEGQRIVGSIQNILKLFMVTVFALLMLIVGITMLRLGFPFTALQNTLLSFFARGAPPFILAISATAVARRSSLSQGILHFTLPASFTIFLFGLLIYIGAFFLIQDGLAQLTITPEMVSTLERTAAVEPGSMTTQSFYELATLYTAQTALVTFFVLTGVMVMVFAEPPLPWFAGGAPYHGRNWLPLVAAVVLIAGYLVIMAVPGLRSFFQLVALPPLFWMAILAMTFIWAFVQRVVWRT
ncbi:MAG: HAD-IC family P-type ATPase, partial [Chloroflexi bacterium]|nr:HAD-IC family P-type ATPase [Chloroflexota bacterium]